MSKYVNPQTCKYISFKILVYFSFSAVEGYDPFTPAILFTSWASLGKSSL